MNRLNLKIISVLYVLTCAGALYSAASGAASSSKRPSKRADKRFIEAIRSNDTKAAGALLQRNPKLLSLKYRGDLRPLHVLMGMENSKKEYDPREMLELFATTVQRFTENSQEQIPWFGDIGFTRNWKDNLGVMLHQPAGDIDDPAFDHMRTGVAGSQEYTVCRCSAFDVACSLGGKRTYAALFPYIISHDNHRFRNDYVVLVKTMINRLGPDGLRLLKERGEDPLATYATHTARHAHGTVVEKYSPDAYNEIPFAYFLERHRDKLSDVAPLFSEEERSLIERKYGIVLPILENPEPASSVEK